MNKYINMHTIRKGKINKVITANMVEIIPNHDVKCFTILETITNTDFEPTIKHFREW